MADFTWHGRSTEGDQWWLECETDLFTPADGFVAVVDVRWEESDTHGNEKGGGMAMLSAQQARELADALREVADNVDMNNNREPT